jgi:addiction module RelE/StbE family toxin
MDIGYKPTFLRDFKKLPTAVQEDAKEKIVLFRDVTNHKRLKVHKLKGKLAGCYSFSVTFAHRIVFQYEGKTSVVFLAIGDHEVYR